MGDRLVTAMWAFLKAVDILLCTLWLAPLYIVRLADKPSGRQMISSYVGRADFNGHRWGRYAAAAIDWMACKLGDDVDHCFRAYTRYKGMDE